MRRAFSGDLSIWARMMAPGFGDRLAVCRWWQQLANQPRHGGLVRLRDGADFRQGGVEFDDGVDEGAAAIAGIGKPFVQGGANGIERAFAGAAMACQRFGETVDPQAVALVEVGPDQVVLAREVPVERDLGHARRFNDAVDAGGADAIAVKKFVRSDGRWRWPWGRRLR